MIHVMNLQIGFYIYSFNIFKLLTGRTTAARLTLFVHKKLTQPERGMDYLSFS